MLGRARTSLRQGIDRDIYAIVRKLEDEQEDPVRRARLTVTSVYDGIKRSNSSLARQKRRPLEDSIERVLTVRREELKADEIEEDSDEILEASIAKSESRSVERDSFILNKQLTKHWNFSSGKQTPTKEESQPEKMDAEGASGTDRLPNGEAKPKRRKGERPVKDGPDRTPPSGVTIHDIAGMDHVILQLQNPIWEPLRRGNRAVKQGITSTNSVLLHGPSGCGKTSLANAIANSVGVSFIPVSCQSVVGGTSGESEKNIRDIFDEAIQLAPCLIFLDEIDAIAGKRDSAGKAMEGRIVAEIGHGMDRVERALPEGRYVVVLAATSRPDSLEPTVRRRFGVEIDIGMPNDKAREKILRSMARGMPLAPDVDFGALAKLTPGFVGADLRQVVTTAAYMPLESNRQALINEARTKYDVAEEIEEGVLQWVLLQSIKDDDDEELPVTFGHFKTAVASVQPAAKREGFSTIPDTTWSHVGAMKEVRRQLETTIIGPIMEPEKYLTVGIKPAAGILLWGPPGCGKTLVAKAVANESKANFISIQGPEVLSKWVGESERAVRQLFSRAKSSAPCVLFFDEMDALVPKRDDSLADSSARLVNTLLTELDGVGDRSGIYVIGATNRPDIIDPAIRRPGRLGTSIFVGLPTPRERVDILRTIYRNEIAGARDLTDGDRRMAELQTVAMDERCNGFSGADLGNLMQAAGKACLERLSGFVDGKPVITMEDWQKALSEVKPSVTDMHQYNKFR